jgi:acyl-CoA hydrolase
VTDPAGAVVTRKRSESIAFYSHLVMPEDLNPSGSIFGGLVVSLMDKVAVKTAARHAANRVVTASIQRIDFLKPVFPGYFMDLLAVIESVGRTSMTIRVFVRADDPARQIPAFDVCEGTFVMVAAQARAEGTQKFAVPRVEEDVAVESAGLWQRLR